MLKGALLLSLVALSAGLALRNPQPEKTIALSKFKDYEDPNGAHKTGFNPKIDIYVINMKERTDKCTCMQSQLNQLPANIFHAIPSATGDDCPTENFKEGMRGGWDIQKAEKSLYCANRKIWERAADSSADFIIILEDDSNLHQGWFEKVREVMQCKDFNHLNVDTAGGQDHDVGGITPGMAESRDGYREDLCNNAGFMNHNGWGSQMQIIKKSFLKTLISHSDKVQGAVDTVFIKSMGQDMGSFRWQAGIVSQIKNDASGLDTVKGCEGGQKSDIGFGRLWPFESKPARLECKSK